MESGNESDRADRRQHGLSGSSGLIRNRDLRISDVPVFDVRALNFSAPQWPEIDRFALSFDGYRFTGLGTELARLASGISSYHRQSGVLAVRDLSWLRALLFIDQRETRATNDSDHMAPDHAAYLQALLDGIRDELKKRPKQVATKQLRAADVPGIDQAVAGQSVPDPRATFAGVWAFARTFDIWRYFAVEDTQGRLGAFAHSVKLDFRLTGAVPPLGEIGMLRACLAYEELRWCKWSDDEPGMPFDDHRYIAALVEAIRTRLK